jgi:hypothetical protein
LGFDLRRAIAALRRRRFHNRAERDRARRHQNEYRCSMHGHLDLQKPVRNATPTLAYHGAGVNGPLL